ncbi:aminopeptidase N-like [Babylonia areolata]|uniref:aminopeptidase N-like n=1 Tax=Babylonia areolata TaxID=304850 RepID=UPI003FD126AC
MFRLPSTLRPLHYQLELFPNIYGSQPADFSLSGRVAIRVLCQEVTSVVTLHAGGGLRLSREEGAMRVTPALLQNGSNSSGVVEVPVAAEIKQRTVTCMLRRFDGFRYLAATIFLPTYARMAFPCFDEPALKAEFTLSLIRKRDFVAMSNMPLASTRTRKKDGEAGEEEEGQWAVDTFQSSPPMSTYLLTFTVCQFLSQEANTSRGYSFKAWSRPESVQQTRYGLEVGVRVMPFFDDYFGIKFPLPQQEMIALPGFQYYGMEHWGLVGYKERVLLYSDDLPSSTDRQRIATIIAHELGHMWFGNLLTMVWWDDTWLNEGFATYAQYLGIDFAFPQWKMLDQFLVLSFRSAMHLDGFERSRPLYTPVLSPSHILAAYDSIIYDKVG